MRNLGRRRSTVDIRKTTIVSAMLLISLTATLSAQTVTGTLQGKITDQSGAILPGVSVAAKNTDTGAERRTLTNDLGFYQMPFLPLGRYDVTAEMSGFKTLVRKDIEITLNQTTVVDMKLEVSPVQETVTVTGEAPAINTTSGEIKRSIPDQLITDKPSLSRNFLEYVGLLPGFQVSPISGQNNPTLSSGSSVNFNGTGSRGATFQIDGVNNDDSSENQNRQNVNLSAIKEFQVITNNYAAEFGRGFGTVVLVQSKSGTNDYHGDLYYLHRNGGVAANSFFRNQAGQRRPPFIRHQYGFTFGGPIQKDKLFGFGSFEGIKIPGQQSITRDVLLPSDWSSRLPCPNPTPRRPCVDPNDPFRGQKEAFIQNIIDRFPAVLPNAFLNVADNRAYITTIRVKQPQEDFSTRIDWNLSEKNYFFFRYQYSHQFFGSDDFIRGEQAVQNNRQQNFGLTATHVFSPKTVGEFRFALGRRRTLVDIAGGNDTPIVRFSGTQFPSIIGNAGAFPIHRFQTDFQYVFNVSTFFGAKHNFKVGADIRRQHLNDLADNFSRPFYTFIGGDGFTPYQNFLRGVVQTFTQGFGPFDNGYRMFEYNSYVQDDYKVTPNFTLNLGFRYELVTAPKEVQDRVLLGIPGFFDGRGDRKISASHNFEPRFGFAYSPAFQSGWIARLTGGPGRFSVRGGYGMFHGRVFQSIFSQGGANVRTNPPNAALIGLPRGNYEVDAPLGRNFVFTPGLPSTRVSLALVDPGLGMPYTHQWNLTVERQLPGDVAFNIGYVGTRGIGLLFYDWMNRAEFPFVAPNHPFVSPQFRGVLFNQVDPNLANSNPPPGSISIEQPRINERRPDPRWSTVTMVTNGSWSYYHSLQVSASKRFSHGLSFILSYTLSKSIDTAAEATFVGEGDINAAPSRPLGARSLRGLSRFDSRHRFTLTYSYLLPFFRAQEGVIGRILGGWQVAGITSFVSGNPFTISPGYDYNADGIGGDRPLLLDPSVLGRSVDHPDRSRSQLPPTAFLPGVVDPTTGRATYPFAPGTANLGTLGRNTFFMQGTNNWDIGVYKNFKVRERHMLVFRTELFNAFNRTQFAQPSLALTRGEDIRAGQISPLFGTIGGQRNAPRQIQFALRYVF